MEKGKTWTQQWLERGWALSFGHPDVMASPPTPTPVNQICFPFKAGYTTLNFWGGVKGWGWLAMKTSFLFSFPMVELQTPSEDRSCNRLARQVLAVKADQEEKRKKREEDSWLFVLYMGCGGGCCGCCGCCCCGCGGRCKSLSKTLLTTHAAAFGSRDPMANR